MDKLDKQILELLPPRTKPRFWGVTGGTGVYKMDHALKDIFAGTSHHVERSSILQSDSERAKIEGEKSLSHILHRTTTVVEFDENDFTILNETTPPELRQDWDKLWNGGNAGSLKSVLNLWFDEDSQLYVTNILNTRILDTVNKFNSYPVNYVVGDYYSRTCIGVNLRTSIANTARYEEIAPVIANHLKTLGWYLIRMHAGALKANDFHGKQELNAYVKSQVEEYKAVIKDYPNGFVILAPNWGYASRSMTAVSIDVGLGLTNSVNPQERDRDLSGLPRGMIATLDGKEKLIGCDIRAPFVTHEVTAERIIDDYLAERYREQKEAYGDNIPDNWRLGIDIAKRVLGSSSFNMLTEDEIDNILTSSTRILREAISTPNFNELLTLPNVGNILDIFVKLEMTSNTSKRKSLIGEIKKKIIVKSTKKRSLTVKEKKSLEDKMKTLQRQICETLIGRGVALLTYTKCDNVFDAIKETTNSQLDEGFETYMGITINEYDTLMKLKDTNGNFIFPIGIMDSLLGAEE